MDILQSQAADSTFPAVSHFAQRGLAEIKSSQEKGEQIMPLSTVERVIFLRGADLFRDISGEDLVLIAQVCHEVFFPAGQLIIRQGDIGDTLFIIVDGTVVIEIEGHGEIDRMGAKEVVGEMAIISRNPRSANCRAITDLTALRIDFDDFWDLLAEKPGLSLGVIRVLSSRLSDRIRDLAEYKLTSEPAQVLP